MRPSWLAPQQLNFCVVDSLVIFHQEQGSVHSLIIPLGSEGTPIPNCTIEEKVVMD